MLITRRQILSLVGYSLASPRTQAFVSCPGFSVPDLQTKGFVVPKVDTSGSIVAYEQSSANLFVEDLGDGVTLDMVAVPGGTFEMGSYVRSAEQPVHLVAISSFFMSAFEATRGMWRKVSSFPKVRHDLGRIFRLNMPEDVENSLPVDIVHFREAEEFCARLANVAGRPYRLPSEAEWEYACRARTSSSYHFGDAISLAVANFNDGVHRPVALMPVGAKNAPNAFGLHDMHGNVAEWCSDWEHANYEGAPTDGAAWVGSGNPDCRIIRGGMYGWNANVARSAARTVFSLVATASGFGFRPVLGPCPDLSIPLSRSRRRP